MDTERILSAITHCCGAAESVQTSPVFENVPELGQRLCHTVSACARADVLIVASFDSMDRLVTMRSNPSNSPVPSALLLDLEAPYGIVVSPTSADAYRRLQPHFRRRFPLFVYRPTSSVVVVIASKPGKRLRQALLVPLRPLTLVVARLLGSHVQRCEQMNEIAVRLETEAQASRAKDVFLATVSHELRTPLNGILAMTHTLLSPGIAPEAVAKYTRVAHDCAMQLYSTITDLLDYSSFACGKVKLESAPVHVKEAVRAVHDAVAPSAAIKHLDLRFDMPDVVIVSDERRLKQILLNLLTNAIKYTDKGSVTTTCTVRPRRRRPGSARLTVTVRDTGCGIEEEDRALVFDWFRRCDHRNMSQGTGLGLPIARKIARAMRGDIRLTNSTATGSTFVFDAIVGSSAPSAERKCEAKRVLIVHANVEERSEASLHLARHHMCPLSCANASEAQPFLRQSQFVNVIVLETHFPEANGYPTVSLHPVATLADRCACAVVAPHPAGLRPLDTFRVLVVDDHPQSLIAAEAMLTTGGVRHITLVDSGEKALTLLEGQSVDLVLLDLRMPCMDGYAVAARIKSTWPTLLVVALTANVSDHDRLRCENAGFDGFLSKPLLLDDLHAMVTVARRFVTKSKEQ